MILCIGWDPFCCILTADRFELSRDQFACFSLVRGFVDMVHGEELG